MDAQRPLMSFHSEDSRAFSHRTQNHRRDKALTGRDQWRAFDSPRRTAMAVKVESPTWRTSRIRWRSCSSVSNSISKRFLVAPSRGALLTKSDIGRVAHARSDATYRLESAFAFQSALDLAEPPFTGSQRRGAGMHRVVSEHEVMSMRRRRTNNELRIGLRMEVDRVI